jgi:ring-1,2-phenylacetyl-CoA epoxidase subunit PaaC
MEFTSPITADASLAPEADRDAVRDLLYQLGDDDLVMGHRDSEWLGLAPEIEEDVAFSSIAQDEVGHAGFYYQLLTQLGEHTVDELMFGRAAAQRRNAVMVERENGDWAHAIVRHYFYDVFEDIRLQALAQSSYYALRQGSLKIRREEFYHLLHHETLVRRLATAGGEAFDRVQAAINQLWADVDGMFDMGPAEVSLLRADILSMSSDDMKNQWYARVVPVLRAVELTVPEDAVGVRPDDHGRWRHSPALSNLLSTLNAVRELDLGANW